MVRPDEIRVYFEGDHALRPGFAAFLSEVKERAKASRCRFSLVATGGKPDRDYDLALKKHPNAWNILLRDSEGPYKPRADTDSTFWMVEMMEAWFHADQDALEAYYGHGFRRNALTPNPRVEKIPKQDLIGGLKAATKDSRKGPYHKTKHAPQLLERIDPAKVRQAAPQCNQLFKAVQDRLRPTCE
jgi:hypothetical protein